MAPTIGLPRMHKEPGERRDFLPSFVRQLVKHGAEVVLEAGYGSGVGLAESEYNGASGVRFAPHEEVYGQDYVLVLRYPSDDELRWMRPGGCLVSMVHLPTRPGRRAFLRELGLEAVSLDSVKDDTGRRLVENLRAVGWNGVEVAFKELRHLYPGGFERKKRPPIQVTLLGSGAVGGHAMQAAVRYGNVALWQRRAQAGIPGVQVTVLDYDLTGVEPFMRGILAHTDLLIDATQRPDPSQLVIPNAWIADLPDHAVMLDLSVDPYDCTQSPPAVKGIEGMPQGNLDQFVFPPDDPAFDLVPSCVDTTHRRTAVSCYSWPGVRPKACMNLYGHQVFPLLRTLIEAGGAASIRPDGPYFHRAISRAMLSRWQSG